MNEIDLKFVLHHTTKVKFFPYRTARVQGYFFQCDRGAKDAQKLEKELAKRADVFIDNHTVYEIENNLGFRIYVWFTDNKVLFGSELIEGRW